MRGNALLVRRNGAPTRYNRGTSETAPAVLRTPLLRGLADQQLRTVID